MKRFIPLFLVTLLVAGCGSVADKNEYVNSVNQAQASLTKSLSAINPAGDPTQIAAELDKGSTLIDTAATDFKAITPPDDAKRAHGMIVGGLQSLAATFRDAAEAARAKDTAKLTEVLGGIQASAGAKELEAAQKELTDNGYKFKS